MISVKRSFLIAITALALVSACKKESPGWKTHVIAYQDQNKNSAEAILPRSLWDKITALVTAKPAPAEGKKESGGHGEAAGEAGNESGGASKIGPLPSVFAPLKVYLIEKNHGILTRGNTSIAFASGGGTLDLRDYLQSKNGSFYIVIEFLPEKEGADRHVYYMSHAVARKLGGDKYGGGCDTYFDISTAYNKSIEGDGFLVNTTEGRHVSALAGAYFFAAAHEGKLFLASLTIKDSRFPALHCAPQKAD